MNIEIEETSGRTYGGEGKQRPVTFHPQEVAEISVDGFDLTRRVLSMVFIGSDMVSKSRSCSINKFLFICLVVLVH